MFIVGHTYKTKSGSEVSVVSATKIGTSAHEIMGNDGFSRFGSGEKAGQEISGQRSDGLTLVEHK